MPTSTAVENQKKISQISTRTGRKPKQIDAREYPPETITRANEEDLVLYEYGTTDPADGEFQPRGFGEWGQSNAKQTVERYPHLILAKRLVHPVEPWDGN